MLKNFHCCWRKITLQLKPKALWHHFGPKQIVLILPPDRFQDKILETPQCRHVRLCMSRVPLKYLLQSSLFTYFTLKWNSIGNHADGNSNPPHNDFSSFAEHPHLWSMTNISLFIFLLAPSGALIAIPTYLWPTPTFSDHSGPQHWTFTFWATTAI